MSPRVTLILALLVAAVGAGVWFLEIEGADERAQAEATAKQIFPDTKPEELTAVVLRTSDEREVRLEREGGWRLVSPIEFPASATAADALATAVADLQTEAIYDDPEPLENYGLGGEATVRGYRGDEELALVIGDATPTGSNTYVAIPGDPRVFTVATYRTNALRKSLDELREPQVLAFDREAVRGVEVAWQGGGVQAVKDGNAWRLQKPIEGAADAGTLEGLLADLRFLRAEGYVDEPDEETRQAVAEPSLRIELRGEGESVLAELRVAAGGDGSSRVVQGRDGHLYRLASDRLDDLPRTTVAFRFKELSTFAVGDVGGFDLLFQDGEGSVAIEATPTEEGGWQSEPEILAPGKASRILSELSSLEAVDIAADSMGPGELAGVGLSPAHTTLRVYGRAEDGGRGEPLAEVSLGRHQEGRGIAAQRAGDPVVYWLAEDLVEHLPLGLDVFRKRFLAEEAEAGDDSTGLADAPEDAGGGEAPEE